MTAYDYFDSTDFVIKKKYDALKDYYFHKKKAEVVAKKYGYTLNSFYSLAKEFNEHQASEKEDFFFRTTKSGRKRINNKDADEIIMSLRKQNHSTEDILTVLHSKGHNCSYQYVYQLLKREGFAKLERRNREQKETYGEFKIKAKKSRQLKFEAEEFTSQSVSLLCFRILIEEYGIAELINNSLFPETKTIDRLSSILSFIALKLSNVRRYSSDDLWCMDRGLGLFAGLNVLPKSAWFSSYSHRVTKEMNISFLKKLYQLWLDKGLVSDSINLDFTTIPYWGDNQHLENNWSGKRTKALSSMLAVLAQDPDSGIISYGDADIRHENQNDTVLEFLDFYKSNNKTNNKLNYLVFDSKFTTYANLSKLNSEHQIKFITIRMRGKSVVDRLNNTPQSEWKKTRVECGDGKNRTVYALDEIIKLTNYEGDVRQIAIKGHGKIKPALIITNDFDLKRNEIVRKYARRWIVEKCISEQIEFFHLNQLSSSMVIKVDFDLTMTILAHNLYRILAQRLTRYSGMTSVRLYEKFIRNSGIVKIEPQKIIVKMKKKRDLPMLLENFKNSDKNKIKQFDDRKIIIQGYGTS